MSPSSYWIPETVIARKRICLIRMCKCVLRGQFSYWASFAKLNPCISRDPRIHRMIIVQKAVMKPTAIHKYRRMRRSPFGRFNVWPCSCVGKITYWYKPKLFEMIFNVFVVTSFSTCVPFISFNNMVIPGRDLNVRDVAKNFVIVCGALKCCHALLWYCISVRRWNGIVL